LTQRHLSVDANLIFWPWWTTGHFVIHNRHQSHTPPVSLQNK